MVTLKKVNGHFPDDSFEFTSEIPRFLDEKRQDLMREAIKYEEVIDLFSKLSMDYRKLKKMNQTKPKISYNIDTGLQKSVDKSLCLNKDGQTEAGLSPQRSIRLLQSNSLDIGAPDISSLIVEEEIKESPLQSSRVEDSNEELRDFLDKEPNVRILDSPKLQPSIRLISPTKPPASLVPLDHTERETCLDPQRD